MAFKYSDMLETIKNRQWALADIDWDAPGADKITDEQRPELKQFMADVVWIEHVGARAFAAMAPKAPFEALGDIYRYFHAEEQRHANAELALMQRWGMLEEGEIPVPNKNIRLVIEWIDRYAEALPLTVIGAAIPALETALDGALLKFLLDEVQDPLCAEVFNKVNNDESRHLAVGFQVLNDLGASPMRIHATQTMGALIDPRILLGGVLYVPLLTRMLTNLNAMGLSEEKLYNAVMRYENVGDRSEFTRRVPGYHILKAHMSASIKRSQPLHFISQRLGTAIDHFPTEVLGKSPTWTEELTYEPVAKISDTTTVLIVGAGFAGLGTAIRLLQQGIDDFVVLERADEVGGTWRDNTYPGAACDIPSLLYSYGFEQNPDWSRAYSGSAEILGYIKTMVDKYSLSRFIRFGVNVTGLEFDEESALWTAQTADGSQFTARTAVMASGPLANASLPDIRGLDTFDGHKIHSARWDHDYDMSDKRVAVIGTGASAVQIIPELVKTARSVKVFQRTPGWVLPRPDFSHPQWVRTAFRRLPRVQNVGRQAWFWGHELMAVGMVWDTPVTTGIQLLAKANLRRQVSDTWLRRQLTPNFRAGCKRMLMSSDYYPALQRDNCKLVSWPIATLSPNGIRTADGIEHELDCIVFATGFDVCKAGTPFPIRGAHGRELSDEWSQGAYAYRSVTVAGYPNLFFTFGPNSGPGHNSALVYMEAEINYIVKAIGAIIANDLSTLEVREDRQNNYHGEVQQRLGSTTWNSGCKSWYLTNDGYNGTMYPGFATQFKRALSKVDMGDYVTTPTTARTEHHPTEHAQNGSNVAKVAQGRKAKVAQGRKSAGALPTRSDVKADILDVGVGKVPPKRAASRVRKDA